MNRFLALLNALRAGEELTHTETWKVRQNAINALVAVIGGVLLVLSFLGIHLQVQADDLVAIAGGLAALGGLLNTYLTTATTRRVGLPPRPEPAPDPTPPATDDDLYRG